MRLFVHELLVSIFKDKDITVKDVSIKTIETARMRHPLPTVSNVMSVRCGEKEDFLTGVKKGVVGETYHFFITDVADDVVISKKLRF